MAQEVDISALESLPNTLGVLVTDINGTVLKATGELSSKATEVSRVIHRLLQDTNGVMFAVGNPADTFKRLTVSVDSQQYIVTIADSKIYAVLRRVST
eukprot:tig00000269_g23780.t1